MQAERSLAEEFDIGALTPGFAEDPFPSIAPCSTMRR